MGKHTYVEQKRNLQDSMIFVDSKGGDVLERTTRLKRKGEERKTKGKSRTVLGLAILGLVLELGGFAIALYTLLS